MNRFELMVYALCVVCFAITIGCVVAADKLKHQRDMYLDLWNFESNRAEFLEEELERTRLKMCIYRDSFLATMGIHSNTKPTNSPHNSHK